MDDPRPRGAHGAGAGESVQVVLTAEMVDSGLEEMHDYLSKQPSEHDKIKGLRRERPAGSHGIWQAHSPGMLYKALFAAKHCGLGVLICDFGQKSA